MRQLVFVMKFLNAKKKKKDIHNLSTTNITSQVVEFSAIINSKQNKSLIFSALQLPIVKSKK